MGGNLPPSFIYEGYNQIAEKLFDAAAISPLIFLFTRMAEKDTSHPPLEGFNGAVSPLHSKLRTQR